jgi:hypothetical protein
MRYNTKRTGLIEHQRGREFAGIKSQQGFTELS